MISLASSSGPRTALSYSFNAMALGAPDECLVVAVSIDGKVSQVASILFGDLPLTFIGQSDVLGANARAEFWALLNPPSGIHPLTVTNTITTPCCATALAFQKAVPGTVVGEPRRI